MITAIQISKLLLLCLLISPYGNVHAKADIDQQNLLATELTPFGAVRAGNGGAIPAWSGEANFIADQSPEFTITAENYKQYEANLSAGQIALFEHYPDSFKMPVYTTQRTFIAPAKIYENTINNAVSAELNTDQSGFINASAGIPFPIPQSAIEVYFNHIGRWRGQQIKNTASDAVVQPNGKFSLISRKSVVRFDTYNEGNQSKNFFSLIARVTAPSSKAGNGLLVLEPLDQLNNSRAAWLWDKGRRRTIRAPNASYDTPIQIADSLRTADDSDLMNGSPDRFDWQLLEKREIYIPYNNEPLSSKNLSYKEILSQHHINPEHTRYELHRVWVIRATLKSEWRHVYSQRDFYLDEDSWQVMIADQYDKAGELWRVSLSYSKLFPQLPGIFTVLNVFHDLHNQRYSAMGLQNERKTVIEFNGEPVKDSLFTPAGLKRYLN